MDEQTNTQMQQNLMGGIWWNDLLIYTLYNTAYIQLVCVKNILT